MEEIDGGGISRTQKATPEVPEQGDTSKGPWEHFGRSETTDGIKCDWKKNEVFLEVYICVLAHLTEHLDVHRCAAI